MEHEFIQRNGPNQRGSCAGAVYALTSLDGRLGGVGVPCQNESKSEAAEGNPVNDSHRQGSLLYQDVVSTDLLPDFLRRPELWFGEWGVS